jgi:hypothetical protein
VQHRADRELDWFLPAPVQAQFDLGTFRGRTDIEAREGCGAQLYFHAESFAPVGRDDGVPARQREAE